MIIVIISNLIVKILFFNKINFLWLGVLFWNDCFAGDFAQSAEKPALRAGDSAADGEISDGLICGVLFDFEIIFDFEMEGADVLCQTAFRPSGSSSGRCFPTGGHLPDVGLLSNLLFFMRFL